MGYQRDDNRHDRGGDRWREEGRHGRDRWARDDDDRGFFERAGEQVRSWFRDDDEDERGGRYEDERNSRYGRERDWGGYRAPYYAQDRGRHRRSGRFDEGPYSDYGTAGDGGGIGEETWGGSGFGGDYDRGRRFDRVDAGSTGTHGAHPMSSAVGGGFGGATGYRSSARAAAAYRARRGADMHDPHYREWRERQLDALDRDYEEYRGEHQARFESEFGSWREKRQSQRQLIGRVTEHMDVVGSDGSHIGTVDRVRGDRLVLTRSDPAAGGHHHSIPCGWVDNVEDKVVINKNAEEAKQAWRDEENRRALFEREDRDQDGPHVLNRSFSGTYRDD